MPKPTKSSSQAPSAKQVPSTTQAPSTKPPVAKPTQRALDRWSGESPAPAAPKTPAAATPPAPPPPAAASGKTSPTRAKESPTAGRAPEPPAPDLAGAVRGLLEAVEVLLAAPMPRGEADTARVQDALERARQALGPPQGQAQMPKAAQRAHDAQRADPAHSPHFGG